MLSLVADVDATNSLILSILEFVAFMSSEEAAAATEVVGFSLLTTQFSDSFSDSSSTLILTAVILALDFFDFCRKIITIL